MSGKQIVRAGLPWGHISKGSAFVSSDYICYSMFYVGFYYVYNCTNNGHVPCTAVHQVPSELPSTAGQANCLQGQDRSAVTHSSSNHVR
ncbi:hypothetical protein J6590_089515, partial [Homalodisca vitripennis]